MRTLITAALVVVVCGGYGSAQAAEQTAPEPKAPRMASNMEGAQLRPRFATVAVGQSVALKVVTCAQVEVPEDVVIEDLLYDCTDTFNSASGPFVDRWSANSIVGGNAVVGTVSPADIRERGIYVAPARAPKSNPVAVSVEYRDPQSKEKQLLVANITVIDPKTNCGELRNTESLKGGMAFIYNFSGTNAAGHRYVIRQGANLAATLKRVPNNSDATWVWRGPAQADGTLSDSVQIGDATERVTGNGGFKDSTFMVVTVRVRDCSYTVSAEVSVNSTTTMTVAGINTPAKKGNTKVGWVGTGVRPVKGGMSGSGDFWIGHGPNDAENMGSYAPGGFGKALLGAFKRAEVSKAEVSWAVAPVRPSLSN